MTSYHGGQRVGSGIYLDRKTGELINLMKTGGELPGEWETEYIKVPAVAMIIFGPLIGLVYVIFLPLIAFAMLVWYGIDRLIHFVSPMQERLVGMASPNWSPVEAHLDGKVKTASGEVEEGKDPTDQDKETEAPGDLLTDLEKEIDRKRNEK